MKCPRCGRTNRDDAMYCFACKSPLGSQGYIPEPVVDESPVYHQEYEKVDEYYEEPSPYEPEEPVYAQEEETAVIDDDEMDGFYEYYVPEDLDEVSKEENVPIYEAAEEEVELTPMYAEDLEEMEEEDDGTPETPSPPDDETTEGSGTSRSEEVEEELVVLKPLPPDEPDIEGLKEDPPAPPPPPKEEKEAPAPEPSVPPGTGVVEDLTIETVPAPGDDGAEPGDEDGDFVITSSPRKEAPVIVFDDDDDDDLDADAGSEEPDPEFESVFFDEETDEEDFEIVPRRELDPKKASNIAMIRAILAKISSLKSNGKDVRSLESKMALVLNTKDEDRKLVLAKACLEDADKLDKETDQEIFEEAAGKFHALRSRLLVLAKKGRDVNGFSPRVDEASQAISLCDFSKAEAIIDEIMAELDNF